MASPTFWEKVYSNIKAGYSPEEIAAGMSEKYGYELQPGDDEMDGMQLLSKIESVSAPAKTKEEINQKAYKSAYDKASYSSLPESVGSPLKKGMTYLGATGGAAIAGLRQLAGGIGDSDAEGLRYLQTQPLSSSERASGGGILGSLALAGGGAATTAPAAAAPGGLLATAGIAGLLSGVNPVANADIPEGSSQYGVRGERAAIDGMIAAGTFGASKAIPAVYRGVVEPYTSRGRDQVIKRAVARAVQEAGGSADELAGMVGMAEAPEILAGSMPTTAQATQNAGMRSLEAAYSGRMGFSEEFANRAAEQNLARQNALRSAFGDDASLEAAKAARSETAGKLYGAADDVVVSARTHGVTPMFELSDILNTPTGKAAFAQAVKWSEDAGRPILSADGGITGYGLQMIKKAADEIAGQAAGKVAPGKVSTGAQVSEGIRDRIVSWGEKYIPQWGAAKTQFAAQSVPVNRMQVGQRLIERVSGTTPMPVKTGGMVTDEAQQMMPSAMERAAGTPARQKVVTGSVLGKQNAKPFAEIFSPEQMQTISAVQADLRRQSATTARGRPAGSDTASNLLTNQFLQELRGTLGPLEKIDAIKGLLNVSAGAASKIAGSAGAAEALDMAIKKMLLDPKEFARIVRSNPTLGAKIADAAGTAGAVGARSGATQTTLGIGGQNQ